MSKEEFNKRRDSHYVDMYKTAAKALEDSRVSTTNSSNRDFDEETQDNDQVIEDDEDFAEISGEIAKAIEVNSIDTKLETENDGQKKSP
uniref:Uncharacterized protein n=1 Tax=Acrobeloides nanus TaxID=290746 RepID=A0A914DPS7_9BILA